MNYIGKFISNFKDFYNEINAATLTGAIDVVVVRQEDGSYHTSPFHVRFGKIGVLRSREKIVDIEINGEPVDIHMKLGESGEAFFVEELEEGSIIDDPQLGTSPLSPSDLLEHLKDLDKDRRNNEERESLSHDPSGHSFDGFKSQDDSGVEAEDHTYAKPKPINRVISTDAGSVSSRSFTDQATELTMDEAIADLSNTFPTQVDKTENGSLHSEIGVVYRVRKNSGKFERRDMETQTIRPVDVPRSVDKGISRSFTEGNARKIKGSVDAPGSKTDIEDVIKPNKNVRRKRKKRNNKAGKGRAKSSGSQSSDNSTTSEVTDPCTISANNSANQDSIFIMEDIDSDKLPGSVTSTPNSQMSQSTSLPLLKERTSTGNKDISGEWNEMMSRSMGPDFHPFSDTDISPPPSSLTNSPRITESLPPINIVTKYLQHLTYPDSPSNSRPPTPIKSDTEYETERTRVADSSSQTDVGKWSWTWGELPTPPPKSPTRKSSKPTEGSGGMENSTSTAADDHGENGLQKQSCATAQQSAEDEERSLFRGMFSFMRATKKVRHNPESEGIYLDDLNLDELDPEVAALYFPRSFKIKERANELPGAKDEDVESGNGPSLPHSPHSVEGAIGGPKILSDSESEEPRHPIFDYRGYHDIAFSRCGGLPEDIPETIFMQNLVTYDDFCENPSVFDDPDLVIRFGGKYLNWKTSAPQIMSLVLFQRPVPTKVKENLVLENMPKREPIRKRTESKGLLWFSSWRRGNQEDGEETTEDNTETEKTQESAKIVCDLEVPVGVGDAGLIEVTSHETQTSLPGTPTKKEMHNRKVGQDSSESEDMDEGKERHPSGERYKKSLRLTSEQIQKFGLKDGPNEVVFSVTTAYQGTSRCKCHIFLWNYDDKIVVSDIDGTITKSDVLGHILPIIGKDWAQSGVAQLFTKIKNNGYHFLYLSARAIGQAHITREYLKSIKQGDLSLPDGPLLLNPTSLVNAFHREVIEKKPEEFKISCLRDVQKLFPQETNPFYAGYGNRINDVWAYKHVGIPISRIFTINHRGELRHELTQAFQSSYCLQSKCVDECFPPHASRMVPRDLLVFMYSDSEPEDESDDNGDNGGYDSEWEGFPTGRDAVELVFSP